MRFQSAAALFSIVYCVAYIAILAGEWALFVYYPQTGNIVWGWQPPLQGAGPRMGWYGLMASAALIALGVSILPAQRAMQRMAGALWLFPLGTMVACIYLMRKFFLM